MRGPQIEKRCFKGGGSHASGGGKGNGKNATAYSTSVISEASVLTGDGYYGPNAITAGTTSTGVVTIDSGVYTIDKLYSGRAYYGYAPTYGKVTLTGRYTDVTVNDPDTPGSIGNIDVGFYMPGGKGYLEILAGATLASINEAYYANGIIYGGFNNLRVGWGTDSYGKVLVSGAGSALSVDGLAASAIFGADGGSGRLEVLDGASATFNSSGHELAGRTVLGGYNNLIVGRDGGTGYALVSGSGSRVIATGGIAHITVGLEHFPAKVASRSVAKMRQNKRIEQEP